MNNFVKWGVVYFVFSFWFAGMLHPDGWALAIFRLFHSLEFLTKIASSEAEYFVGFVILLGIAIALDFRRRVLMIGKALLGTLLFQNGFVLVKTTMPYVVPFYADHLLADIDHILHFGNDPWVLTHSAIAALGLDVSQISRPYVSVWFPPALCLPIIMAAIDGDKARVDRFLALYAIGWVVIGNLFALMFMSVGPVFLDQLDGGSRFAELSATLSSTGWQDTLVGTIQDLLWADYVYNAQATAAAISAFPSVHVSTTVVVALYFSERWRLAIPFSLFATGYILIMSVASGYHYAIDGYFSIFVVVAAWLVIKNRQESRYDVALRPQNDARELTV